MDYHLFNIYASYKLKGSRKFIEQPSVAKFSYSQKRVRDPVSATRAKLEDPLSSLNLCPQPEYADPSTLEGGLGKE